MNLSKKSRYGITALIDLAVYAKDQCVQLSSIAERNNISVKYLEQIFSSLRKSGLVRSVKGPQGGYLLAKRPESITVADVIHALDGSYLLEDERSVVSGTDEKGKKKIQEHFPLIQALLLQSLILFLYLVQRTALLISCVCTLPDTSQDSLRCHQRGLIIYQYLPRLNPSDQSNVSLHIPPNGLSYLQFYIFRHLVSIPYF